MLNAKLYFSDEAEGYQRSYLKFIQHSESVRTYYGIKVSRLVSVEMDFSSKFEGGDYYRLEKKENNKWWIFDLNNKKYVQIKMFDKDKIMFDLKAENEITNLSETEFELDPETRSLKLSGDVDIKLFCEII